MTPVIPDLVSTIIPVWNRPAMLCEAVASVLAQSHTAVEVIIVDDGSTDETASVAEELTGRHPDRVFLLRKPNSGPGPSREAGRLAARGEFIQYLDSDDRLLPNKFADQIRALREHPECDIAYGVTRLINESNTVLEEPYRWTHRQIPFVYPGLLVDRWWCTHTPLYRRSLTDRIGAWSDMRWSQDWEYDARAGGLGAKLVSCGTCVSEHRQHDGVRQTSGAAWTTDPVRLRNRLRLLKALWNNAVLAGIGETTCPERLHFARWCFAIGRQCSVQGLSTESRELFQLAEQSAGDQREALRGVGLFRWLTHAVGGRTAGRIFGLAERLKRPSAWTLSQSFASNKRC